MIKNMPMADYQSNKSYSASDFRAIGESPAGWKYKKSQPRKTTRAMEIGSATHLYLESRVSKKPEIASAGLAVYESGSSKTKGFEKFQAEHPGVYCLDQDEYDLVCRAIYAVEKEPEVMSYLNGAIMEPSFFVTDPETGLQRKCRPDFLHVEQGVSINIKTTLDCSESGFFRSIKDFGYDWQTVNYQDVLSLHYGKSFDEIHVLIEKTEDGPCRVAIRGIDDDTLDQARFQMRKVMDRVIEFEKTQVWKDPPAQLMISTIPHWARTLCEI